VAGVEWIRGDALNRSDLVEAADGTALIVHAVNPPGYRNWRGLALPMLENTIAAARTSGVRIFFPGTVYNFDPGACPVVAEDTPQQPATRKGRIRVEMEACLRQASEYGVKILILRAGGWFGPQTTGNSWFSAALVKPGRPLRSVVYRGRPDAGHAWAYLPDVAETAMRLIEREVELPPYAAFHFGGHRFERGVDIAEAVRAAAGKPNLPIQRFPWWLVRVASPFVETFREMLEDDVSVAAAAASGQLKTGDLPWGGAAYADDRRGPGQLAGAGGPRDGRRPIRVRAISTVCRRPGHHRPCPILASGLRMHPAKGLSCLHSAASLLSSPALSPASIRCLSSPLPRWRRGWRAD
jgi:nucleoside-diphosphate-sugar epimerase